MRLRTDGVQAWPQPESCLLPPASRRSNTVTKWTALVRADVVPDSDVLFHRTASVRDLRDEQTDARVSLSENGMQNSLLELI